MRKILLLLLITINVLLISAQIPNKIEGVYGENGDPWLYIFSNGTYAITLNKPQIGTWQKQDENLLMIPDTSYRESFHIFALYNSNIEDISVQFGGFESNPSAYSLNNGETDVMMHPVSDPGYHCAPYFLETTFNKGEYTQIQLAQLPYFTERDSTLQSTVYTFPIDPRYNEFKIIWNDMSPENFEPFTARFENNKLYFDLYSNSYEFDHLPQLNKSDKKERKYIKEMASSANRTVISAPFETWDKNDRWVTVYYPRIPHSKKEYQSIAIDTNNLFKTKCPEEEDVLKDIPIAMPPL